MSIKPDLLSQFRLQYYASLAATPEYQDNFDPSILHIEAAPTFYDFLLSRGYTRYQLSAHGISKDIQ